MKLTWILAAAAATAMTMAGAELQPKMRAKIPFSFRVADRVLPAGTYEVWTPIDHKATTVRQIDGTGHAMIIAQSASRKTGGTGPVLVFNRYGEAYYLRQVFHTDTRGNKLPISKAERETIAAGAAQQVASIPLK